MKKLHLVAILMIVIAVVVITSASGDVSSYATFDTAIKSGDRVKIAGQLVKTKEIIYNPDVDANATTFFLVDDDNVERQVVLSKPKPQDFELSEQVVLTGSMKGETFYADEVLLKCPSKYKDEEIYIKGDS